MKIKKLTLKNFKFFYGEENLEFEGKNILIYGENGSGKSSIYWALYTLLNNAKSQDRKIQKYFTHHDEKSLLNRYIPNEESGKVSIELDNDQKYTISVDPLEININKTDPTIKAANLASDFISYKLLSKLYDFKHGDTIDLFELFESDIFDYMSFNTQKTYSDEWMELKKIERNPPRKKSWLYDNFIKRVEKFNEEFKYFVSSIKEFTNELLDKYFSANYTVEISYRDLYYYDRPRLLKGRYLENPKINITIKLNSQGLLERNRLIKKPHTFLNEAKLTAIALSIRLAVLRTRVTGENILKILVLDDLLISLDMSNRDIVLHMLIEDEYLKDYQIVMLTHDRAFYERTKQIFDYKAKDKWKYYEMYLDIRNRVSFLKFTSTSHCSLLQTKPINPLLLVPIECPYIKKDQSFSERAKQYYKNKDYPAAATYLRKEVERLYHKKLDLGKLESIIEISRKLDNYKQLEKCFPPLIEALTSFKKCKDIPKAIRVKKCLKFSEKMEKAINEVYDIFKQDTFFDIGLIKDHILNPQSHNDFTKPLYKKELEDAFMAIEMLKKAVERSMAHRIRTKREILRNKRNKRNKIRNVKYHRKYKT